MNLQQIENLIQIKEVFIFLKYFLFILLIATIFLVIFIFKKRKIVFSILLFILFLGSFSIFKATSHEMSSEYITLVKEIPLQSDFGIFSNKLKSEFTVVINKDNNLIQRVAFASVKTEGLLGDKVLNGEYRITNSGSRVFLDVDVKNQSVPDFYIDVPNVKEENIIANASKSFSSVSLKDTIIDNHFLEINGVFEQVFILSTVLGLFYFVLGIYFVKHILNKNKLNKKQ